MIRTPIKTRSLARAERDAKTDVIRLSKSSPPHSMTIRPADTTFVAGSSHMETPQHIDVPHPLPAHSMLSKSSSALRKRLEYERAIEKAKIANELIDLKYEADLADLKSEKYSSHQSGITSRHSSHISNASKSTRQNVEDWIERSSQELDPLQRAPEDVDNPRDCDQPAAPDADSNGTIKLLATAVKNLTLASTKDKSHDNILSRMCMPRDLPKFSGDPLEWLQFKQAFEESTEVCKFTPKENLWRLRKCLHGQAKETVSALLMSAASPDRIMATLELRHGDPECIISRLIHDIKKLQPMSQEYQKDIVNFSVKVQNFVESVKAVGREEYVQGLSIVPLLISKIPPVLVSKWSDYSFPLIKEGGKSRLSIMSDFLNTEAVKIATTANVNLQNYRPEQNKQKQHDTITKVAPKAQAILLQTDQRDNTEKNDKCSFCRTQYHELPDCKKFKRALRKDRWRHVKKFGLCYKCISQRHDRETCSAPMCDKDNCGDAHHSLLHYEYIGKDGDTSISRPVDVNVSALPQPESNIVTEPTTSSSTSSPVTEAATCSIDTEKHVLLKVVPVNIHGPNGVFSTTAFLDDGSTVSLLSVELAARVGLFGHNETMRVCGAWKDDELVREATVVNLQLCLGQDDEPSATRTPLGWCIHGPVHVPRAPRAARPAHSAHATLHLCVVSEEDAVAHALRELHDEVRRSFAIDSLGVAGKPRENVDDVKAQEMLDKSAVLINGRWSVGLPWKDPHVSLPDSYPSAFKRLQGVEKKMRADKAYGLRYEERVNHLFENDFAREMADTSLTPNTWYLPHFGVDNPNKKKLRLVYDAAAKSQGKSLNDFLLTGPDLLASLFGIMVRFREDRVAVTGDIKDMFLRIKINPVDQNALRFLWRGRNPTGPVKTYAMTSLIFGANCSPFIAQYIKNKNASRFESSLPAAVAAIHCQHYMDDYIDSLPDEASAIEMVKNIRDIHSAGGFEIRNWMCNSAAVLDTIPKDILGDTAVKLGQDEHDDGERTLGLIWYPAKDELGFDVSFKRIPDSVIKGEQRPTKRVMLRVIMSIFDIFGFLSPFTTQGKVMLQDTWRLHIDWDGVIPDELYKKWCSWLELLKLIGEIRLPRWYQSCAVRCKMREELTATLPGSSLHAATQQSYNDLELHVFSDASLKAMSAVAYWRWKSNDQIFVSFVASKSRVSSVKPQTVPRLELQAALLAARLADSLAKAHRLNITRRHFWCDSSTVLHWIGNNTRRYKTFEANRLGEIDELSKPSEWRYVPTGLNVADIATRETFNYQSFLNEWFKGPEFLYSDETFWPANVLEPENEVTAQACMTIVQNSRTCFPVPDPERFPSFLRFLRTTACVLKFIHKCRGIALDDYALMQKAKQLILRQAQEDSFASEIQAVRVEKELSRDSRLRNLSPYLDENNVLRVSGRIDAVCDVSLEAKRPIILDGRHPTTRLLVKHYHMKAAHGHQEAVVNDLKQEYWIIQLRPTVKNVASRCMLCRLRKATPQVPRMERAPRDETLNTLLAEVEGIVNGRPLTHVSVEPGSSESLTPNHFLIGSSSRLPVHGVFDDSDLALRKQWRIAQRLADMYWKRWMKEFLPLLIPRKKWQQEQKSLSVGDLVLVVDPDSPRNVWPRGLIKSVLSRKDGRIRVVDVSTATGVLRRSVARVAPVPLVD
ncbi:uncharacterized protein LOC125230728 [Leguminivora glycinivorella]|uniref:uncharacterized protein LOC125230728 n=1 Tax=Leguminivora glycinivorella TaxID=1035111 RepID=UPI00200BB57C|nr:uncharacterized protein LOC125230728 [Leguminivora glycinivorella]